MAEEVNGDLVARRSITIGYPYEMWKHSGIFLSLEESLFVILLG